MRISKARSKTEMCAKKRGSGERRRVGFPNERALLPSLNSCGRISSPARSKVFFLDSAAKLQVLCHLANFAYDPINYVHLRDLGVISLFLGTTRLCTHARTPNALLPCPSHSPLFSMTTSLTTAFFNAKFLPTTDCLGDGNEDPRFVEFAMAGLSNLALGNLCFHV